jgi:ATP phosphoribosyltransferase regulatory subunit
MVFRYTVDGFEDISCDDYSIFQMVNTNLSKLFSLFGYHQISTPTLEAYDVYNNYDHLTQSELFKVISRRGKILVLRPDGTIPVARMAATKYRDQDNILKFSYITNIYRNFSKDDVQKKEVTHAGVEYLGSDSPACDAEIIHLGVESLYRNFIKDIHIDIGHVGFLNSLLDPLELDKKERSHLLILIERKNIADIRSYIKDKDYPATIKEMLLQIPKWYGEPLTVLGKVKPYCQSEETKGAWNNLSQIYDIITMLELPATISFDLGFTNEMNYYTGLVFKTYIYNQGEPIITGGRYDTLSNQFGVPRAACGFALDVLQLSEYLRNNTPLPMVQEKRIIFYDHNEKDQEMAFKLADNFRISGLITETFLLEKDPKDLIKGFARNSLYQKVRYYLFKNGCQFIWENNGFIRTEGEYHVY